LLGITARGTRRFVHARHALATAGLTMPFVFDYVLDIAAG
jgi:hypothetical protein